MAFMTILKQGLGAAALAGLVAGAALPAEWLGEAEIESVIKGHTLEGMYASERRFTERYLEGGALEYQEGDVLIHGHWSVKAGTLCTIYDTDPTGGCFRVSASAPNGLEFYFVSRSEEAAPGPPGVTPDWGRRGAPKMDAWKPARTARTSDLVQ
jgi:hypothetical protein